MLTKKQRDLLIFIHEAMQKDDIAPSFEEMKEHLGLKSKSGIHRLITGLCDRGFLRRLPHKARALEVVRVPDGYVPSKPQIESPANYQNNSSNDHNYKEIDTVPLYGKIAAGTPIEAIRHEGNMLNLPAGMLGNSEYYALEIDGDSMTGAGIYDGDTVIIDRAAPIRDGDIVVALVDDAEVTLKTLKREGGMVLLIPENPAHDIRILEQSRVQFQGKLASLFRRYH